MLHQPLRLGGLALTCALATVVLTVVTLVASNLLLSVVAALGPGGPAADGSAQVAPVQGVLVAAEARSPRDCRRDHLRDPATRADRHERCGRHAGKGRVRP